MICMPKNLFNDHFIFGNCTIKLIRSKSCHFIRLSNDGADLFRSLLEVTQEGRIRATSGLQEKSLVLILSRLTMKILDFLRNVFQQICQTNRYSCVEKIEHVHKRNVKIPNLDFCSSTNKIKYTNIQFQEKFKRSKNPSSFLISF